MIFVMSVMTTLTTRNNKDLIPDLIELLSILEVDYFVLERFIPEGQGESNTSWILSKKRKQKKILIKMTEQALQDWVVLHLLLYRTLYIVLCSDDNTVGAMCSAGVSALTILPDATAFYLVEDQLPIPIGNVLKMVREYLVLIPGSVMAVERL